MTGTAPSPEVTQLLRDALTGARAGDRTRSHELFRQATLLDPSNAAVWVWYANTATDPFEVVRGLRAALELNANSAQATAALPAALFRAGVAAAKSKDRERAAELLADATALDPTCEAAWLWRAGVCDEPARAIEYLERALKLNPNNAQAREGLDRLRAQLVEVHTCPVCEHTSDISDTLADVCPHCGAVVNLSNPVALDRPPQTLAPEIVKAAARRLKNAWSATADPKAAFGLAVALLNLGYRDEGLRALGTAARTAGADPSWREAAARFAAHRPGRAAGAPAREVARVPVMIVDDSPTVRAMVSAVLTGAGYRVIAAGGADEATQLIRAGTVPRLFVLDVNMPGTDGFGLCKVLRAHAETADIPVVFLTGKTGLLSKIHGRWVGAAEYLTKPFQNETLLATVARLTAART